MYDLQEITSLEALEALVPEWSALLGRLPGAAPFLAPQWLVPWWRHLGGGELWVMALRRDQGTLVGLAPLFVYPRSGRRVVAFLGSGISDELDLLAEAPPAAAAAVFARLRARVDRWDTVELTDLPEESALLSVECPLSRRLEPGDPCQLLELPASAEEFRRSLRPHQARNLRRAHRLLGASGEVRGEWLCDGRRQAGLETLFALHAARWGVRGEAGVLSSAALQAFHREASTGLAEAGWLRLRALRVGEATAAVLYGFARGGRAFAYLSGFDPRLGQGSPGTLLTAFAIEESIREGASSYDFLRGTEGHKATWGAHPQPRCRLVIG